MSLSLKMLLLSAPLLLGLAATSASAQTPVSAPIPEYGPNITLAQARVATAAAEATARANQWPVAIAIVDTAGHLVLFQRSDNTQTASMHLAVDKAVTAATFRRPTQYFQEALGQGGERLSVLTLQGVSASNGGIPLWVGGKIVGAIGVSGVSSAQDGQVAKAGAAALK